jgi:hypothetical protein
MERAGDGERTVIIKMEDLNPDPLSNVIEFTRKKREPLLEPKRADYKACRHVRTTVDEEKRVVSCRDCEAQLDPFQVLWEMANKERRWLDDLEAWEAMRDSRLSDRYDAEWQRHVDDIIEPPTDRRLREIWDTFHGALGDGFCAMYHRKRRKRRGPEWYGRDNRGSTVSLEYARAVLVPKIVTVKG